MNDLRIDDEARLRRVLRYLEAEAPLPPDLHEAMAYRIQDRGPQTNESRHLGRALIPILASMALFAVIGVSAFLLGGSEFGGNAPPQTTIQERIFNQNVNGWTLIAMLRFPDEADAGLYRGPLPDADEQLMWITGERQFWPPRNPDGSPLLLYKWNSDERVELHERPYALAGGRYGFWGADPLDLLGATANRDGTVVERAERVDIVDRAAWEEFLAAVESSRQAREPSGN